MPVTAPVSPSLSSASDTAQESSCARRARLASVVFTLPSSSFSVRVQVRFVFSAFWRAPHCVNAGSVPICKAHGAAGARLRPITGDVIDLVILQPRGVHRRDYREPVLRFGGADFEVALGQTGERIFVTGLHRVHHLE